ncbi:signal peptidase II [Chitinivorax sp. B]|uniref:signal peptidase II n=1 Tax=Chitinivorax sp. B TaxID=2502235 RepID=UPI0010F9267E|nr:signal peptidase II [Chitinivorax sp. B]
MRKWLLLALIIVIADQVTKLWIDGNLFYGQTIPVVPSFNIVKAYNPGAAFSFLADAGGWQRHFFSLIAIVVSGAIIWMLRKQSDNKVLATSLSLILGGAIGNLIDRIAYGHVVDFIQVYYQQLYWPAFNIADSAITVGAALMVIDSFRKQPASPT